MKMEFRSKPQIIEAEQFFPEMEVWPKGIIARFGKYLVYNKLHDSYIQIYRGDWVRTDNDNDRYSIAKEYMEKHYEAIL